MFHHQNQSVEQHYGLTDVNVAPSIPSYQNALQVSSQIFSSPKHGDNNFDIDTLLVPKYDSSPPRITINNSNSFLPDPARITSLTPSFFKDLPSMGTYPPIHPHATTSSDPINP